RPDVLARIVERFYGEELKARMRELNVLREEYAMLLALERGDERPPDGTFRFRGRCYDVEEAERLLQRVGADLDEDMAWLYELDERVFRAHYQMARELGGKVAEELLYRYRFHMAVQAIDVDVATRKPPLEWALEYLSTRSRLCYEEFHEIRTIFREAHDALMRAICQADKWPLPRLQHVREGALLGEFLLDGQVIKGLRPTVQTIKAVWVERFLGQLRAVQDRIRRIHFKSLGA